VFSDGYDMNLLQLKNFDGGLTIVKTWTDSKRLGICEGVIEMDRIYDINFS
jgi:hypothetical protein